MEGYLIHKSHFKYLPQMIWLKRYLWSNWWLPLYYQHNIIHRVCLDLLSITQSSAKCSCIMPDHFILCKQLAMTVDPINMVRLQQIIEQDTNGLVQDCSISIVFAMEIPQYYTHQSIYHCWLFLCCQHCIIHPVGPIHCHRVLCQVFIMCYPPSWHIV